MRLSFEMIEAEFIRFRKGYKSDERRELRTIMGKSKVICSSTLSGEEILKEAHWRGGGKDECFQVLRFDHFER